MIWEIFLTNHILLYLYVSYKDLPQCSDVLKMVQFCVLAPFSELWLFLCKLRLDQQIAGVSEFGSNQTHNSAPVNMKKGPSPMTFVFLWMSGVGWHKNYGIP